MVRIVIADDSILARELLKAHLDRSPDIVVVGEASTGIEAVSLVKELKPDVAIIDITMPKMDGLEAIEIIMASTPTPILVCTSLTDADIAFKAISRGALEVIEKPKLSAIETLSLPSLVKMLAKVKVIRHLKYPQKPQSVKTSATEITEGKDTKHRIEVIGIAASTGGPKALATILAQCKVKGTPPIIIAQHIGLDFSSGLVAWLNTTTPLTVKEASNQEEIEKDHVYIAPSGYHIEISSYYRIRLLPKAAQDCYLPSCDKMLSSLAQNAGNHAMGIILTGMGRDGAEGMLQLYHSGGITLAQNAETSVVFGMPKAAIENNSIKMILPLEKIASAIYTYIDKDTIST